MVSEVNVLLIDEPPTTTTQLAPKRSLELERLVIVREDVGALTASNSEIVIFIPDADKDFWSESYEELIFLS